jgi:hypothetical protein
MTDYILCEPKDKSKGIFYFKTPKIIKTMTNKKNITATIDIKFNKDVFCNLKTHNKNKILQIKTINSYNAFNEKYGYIKHNTIHIKWNSVKEHYAGIFMNTKGLKWEDYWHNAIFKNKKYWSYFDGYEFPFVELDNKIVIWRPVKIIILKD